MSESPRERLSALMDGELTQADAMRLLEDIVGDADLRRCWERYHFISDVLRNDVVHVPTTGLLERVRRDLEAEPAIYRLGLFRKESLRPLAGLALAASVAVVAVIGFRGAAQAPTGGGDLVAGASREGAMAVQGPGGAAQTDPRLDAYLVKHSERTGGLLHGAMPYARLVTYNASR